MSYTPAYLAERIRAATLTDGERKTITALFADLKGSTALIEGLDPEEARAIIDPALQLMMDAVHRYEGYVAQALGDGPSPQPSPQRGEGKSPRPSRERDRVRVIRDDLHTLKQLILDKTQGTPFFIEEIVQDLKEQGVLRHDAPVGWVVTHPTTALQLPPTVQGVLAARIDRLTPDEKALLQQLAVLGREFPVSLLLHVITQSEEELYRVLASLQRKEFLYEQPAFPEVEYIFKHALTQEVAYNSVLQERRKALHERTAQAIESLYAGRLEEHYSELVLQQESQKSKGKSQKAKIGFGNWELGSGSLPSKSPTPESQIPVPSLEAEACFLKAIEIAQKQQAKSLELRAVMSLVRLWRQQGKKAEAHQMLAEIYGWFTEGFETKDLQEAQALLAELGANADEDSCGREKT